MARSPRPGSTIFLGIAFSVFGAATIAVADVLSSAALVYPLLGTRVSSDYGNRKHPIKRNVRHHDGIDLAAPKAAPIRAVGEGVVVYADPFGGYGNLVVIRHANGMTTHYGHCDEIRVQTGQRIQAGAVIATVGSTGKVTGPHLHFEIRRDGKPLDPESLLPGIADSSSG